MASPGDAGSEPEAEPVDGPQITSRLGPVRGDGRNKFRFDGYMEHPSLQWENEVEDKVHQRRLQHGVFVLEDGGFQLPSATWCREEACIPQWMSKLLPDPTPLQAVVWPLLRTNRDVVVIAEHGCGKTLAYAVPVLIRAAALQGAQHEQPDWCQQTLAWQEWRQRPPDGVILVPTAEMVRQVKMEIQRLAAAGRVHVAGGDEDAVQQKELSRAGILVLTPWQLQCQSWVLGKDEDLAALNQDVLIIFDEADDIIKDGDDEGTQARTILDFMPTSRMLAFFSSTWPRRTDEMARRHLRNDTVMVYATTECVSNSKSFCLESRFVVQRFEVMNPLCKQQKLLTAWEKLAKRMDGQGFTLGVFCNKQDTAEQVAQYLTAHVSVKVVLIHELMDLAEPPREAATILVATTMLGRGYKFPKMQWLINYDMPSNLLEYLSRIRLASRCHSPGTSLTFITPADLIQARELKELLEDLGQDSPKELKEAAESFHAHALRINPELVSQPRSHRRFGASHRAFADSHLQERTMPRAIPDADWKDWKPKFGGPASSLLRPAVDLRPSVQPKTPQELPDLIFFD